MDVLRKCKCGTTAFTLEELIKFTKDKKGKYGRSNLCALCAKNKRLKWAKNNRDKVNKDQQDRKQNNKIKSIRYCGSKCTRCNLEYNGKNASVFDFHHLNPQHKEFKPSDLMRYQWDVIEKEINKCVLLCANCHRLEHQPLY